MHVTARSLWAPKAGNRSEEYEDAFWPPRPIHRSINRTSNRAGSRGGLFRCAVADGATETSFAGLWARQLVRAFGQGCFGGAGWLEHLRREQELWYAEVMQKPLPWYAEEKVRSGAYAALLGLEISCRGGWHAFGVGDCCLLQWRHGELRAAFPANSPDFFTSRPYLVPSSSAANGGLADRALRAKGTWQPGDHFALLSDALGHWAWRRIAAGEPPWAELERQLQDGRPRGFAQWVAELRDHAEVRNDDMTAVLVTVA
jgi:hypothetical protein